MAYQNTGTPRFYVNVIEWLVSNGFQLGWTTNVVDEHNPAFISLFNTHPIEPFIFSGSLAGSHDHVSSGNVEIPKFTDKTFIAVLGHNMASSEVSYVFKDLESAYSGQDVDLEDIVNGDGSEYDGFSIQLVDLSGHRDYIFAIVDGDGSSGSGIDADIGSIIIGRYYDMPHSPELKLTMIREMDGVKRIRTLGGHDLVNHKYTKPTLWGSAAPWELYSGTPSNQKLSRSGRRVWDLSFSHLQDSDVFPKVSNLNWTETPYIESTAGGRTLLDDDTFYSQVIHKTNGGQLPFIFQPDAPRLNASTGLYEGGNNNPDNFAIAKLDMKSFTFSQVSMNTYNCKIRIKEVW